MNLADNIKHDGRVDFEDNDKSYTVMSVVPVMKLKQALQELKDSETKLIRDILMGKIDFGDLQFKFAQNHLRIFGEELLK